MSKTFFCILKKYRSFLLYIIFGIATTAVNIICYYLFSRVLQKDAMLSNVSAWLTAVFFAYVVNKKWVFESRTIGFLEALEELAAFFGCRLITGGLDMLVMFIGIKILIFPDMIVKFVSNIIVILVNYAASRFIIFRNDKHIGDAEGGTFK